MVKEVRRVAVTLWIVAAFLGAAWVAIPETLGQQPALQVGIVATPTKSEPGTSGVLKVTMENLGTLDLYRVELTRHQVTEPIVISAERYEIGGAAPDQEVTVTVPFDVPQSATAGFYSVRFLVNYCQVGGASDCGSFLASTVIEVQTPTALRLASVTPTRLDQWGEEELTFDVENTGASRLASVDLSWSTPKDEILPLGGTSRVYLDSLDPWATRAVRVPVATDPDAPAGVVPVTVVITATDVTGNRVSTTSVVGVRIGGLAEFDVTARMQEDRSIDVSVANIGVNPAVGVSLRLWPDGQDASMADVAFLGDLDAGDFTTVTFADDPWGAFAVDGIRPDAGIIALAYSDGQGARQERTYDVALGGNGGNGDEDGGIGPLVWFVLLVALGVLVTLIVRQRRARQRAAAEADEAP